MQFCDFANKAGREQKTKQASRGLYAIAELLVKARGRLLICINIFRWRLRLTQYERKSVEFGVF